MGEITVITSGKGGVGKTTATAGLGAALAAMGRRVALIDADVGLRNLDAALGLENRIVYDLVDVLQGACTLEKALITHPQQHRLDLVPAPQGRQKAAITAEKMLEVAGRLAHDHDDVLVDCAAGIGDTFTATIAAAQKAIVVTVPEVSAVRDARQAVRILKESKLPARVLLNRVRPNMVRRGEMMDVESVLAILELELLGIVPEDEDVVRRNNQGYLATDSHSQSAQAYGRMARRMVGESVPIQDPCHRAGPWRWLKAAMGARG